jgi:hypothetical protein
MVFLQLSHNENLIRDGGKGLQAHTRLVQLVNVVQNRPKFKKLFKCET